MTIEEELRTAYANLKLCRDEVMRQISMERQRITITANLVRALYRCGFSHEEIRHIRDAKRISDITTIVTRKFKN
jgi:hypothetical protein